MKSGGKWITTTFKGQVSVYRWIEYEQGKWKAERPPEVEI